MENSVFDYEMERKSTMINQIPYYSQLRKRRTISPKQLFKYIMLIICFIEPTIVSLKMISFLDEWIFLPTIPDFFDFCILLVCVSYLYYETIKNEMKVKK